MNLTITTTVCSSQLKNSVACSAKPLVVHLHQFLIPNPNFLRRVTIAKSQLSRLKLSIWLSKNGKRKQITQIFLITWRQITEDRSWSKQSKIFWFRANQSARKSLSRILWFCTQVAKIPNPINVIECDIPIQNQQIRVQSERKMEKKTNLLINPFINRSQDIESGTRNIRFHHWS